NVRVIANGVDVAALEAERPAEPHDGIRVGMLGRLDPQKGAEVFVKAAAASAHDGVEFVIGGTPGPYPSFERRIRADAAASGVRIEDPGADGIAFIASLDLVIMPTLQEGSPLTLFESLALGKPVIASSIPGIREVLEPNGSG